jgi:hypothetical protein
MGVPRLAFGTHDAVIKLTAETVVGLDGASGMAAINVEADATDEIDSVNESS